MAVTLVILMVALHFQREKNVQYPDDKEKKI